MANIHASVAEPMSGNLKAEKCLVQQSFRSATNFVQTQTPFPKHMQMLIFSGSFKTCVRVEIIHSGMTARVRDVIIDES